MSTLTNKSGNVLASRVWFSKDMLYVLLKDGREIRIPLLWFPRLRKASEEQLDNWRFIGIGIHWEVWTKTFLFQRALIPGEIRVIKFL